MRVAVGEETRRSNATWKSSECARREIELTLLGEPNSNKTVETDVGTVIDGRGLGVGDLVRCALSVTIRETYVQYRCWRLVLSRGAFINSILSWTRRRRECVEY